MALSFKDILLVSDIDGTLYNKDIGISQRNIDAINRFIRKGGNFTLATGRSPESIKRIIEMVPISAPAILSNGSAIYDYKNKMFITEHHLTIKAKGYLKQILEAFPHLGSEVLSGTTIFVVRMSEYIEEHVTREKVKYTMIDLDEAPDEIYKIFFATDIETLNKIRQFALDNKFEDVYMVQTEKLYIEMMPAGVSKALGLKELAEYLSIKHENTYAIGDFYNDIDMIKSAGVGVSVENAPEEVKKVAKLVVGHCNDGAVADIIEYIEAQIEK